MAATIRSFAPYLLGIVLLGVAVAGLLPGVLDAVCGIAGIVLLAVYAVQRARSGELGYRRAVVQDRVISATARRRRPKEDTTITVGTAARVATVAGSAVTSVAVTAVATAATA